MGLTGAAQGRGGAAPLLCTVAHPRETGLVQALWSSLRSRHELGRMYVLWLEPPPRWLRRDDEPIELEPADVGLERPRHAAFAHDAAALRALLRPRLVEFLLDSGRAPSHVVCVDPGAALRAPLDPLVSLAARSSAVLVPRRSREDRDAAGRGLLEAGAFDDGLVAVGSGEGARELVAWWGRRAAEDPGGRWLDLAPALFPAVVVEREPGLGPAEPAGSGGWRLLRSAHERYPDGVPVASGERAFLRASDPEGIRFPDPFRLDGPDPFRAWAGAPADGLLLPGVPTPTRLAEWLLTSGHLGERLLGRWFDHRFEHRRDFCAWLRRHGREALGIEPARLVRSVADQRAWAPLVARELPLAARGGAEPAPPEIVETAGGDPLALLRDPALAGWLAEPADHRYPPLPRGAMALYAASPGIWREYPSPLDGDRGRYARWCVDEGPVWGLPGPLVAAIEQGLALPLDQFGSSPLLREWARRPVDDRWPTIPHVALAIRERWPAVSARFPDPLGADRVPFARWFVGDCAARVYLPPTATVRTRATLRLVQPAPALT